MVANIENNVKSNLVFFSLLLYKTNFVFISISWQLHPSAIVFAMSKVLHTTTNNGFRLFEEYFLFSKLLAAINGNFFCVSYHFPLFSPLWCRLLLTSPYLKWVRSELNSEKCLWTLSPPGTALSTKLRHSFLIMKDQICWSGQRGSLLMPRVKTDKGHSNGLWDNWVQFFWSHSWIWHRNFDPAVKLNHCAVRILSRPPPHCRR